MKALPSTFKWLGSGLGLWALLACSAEASQPPPHDGTGNQGQGGGSAGTGTGLPMAGTGTGLPMAGTTGGPQGGTGNTSTAGTAGVATTAGTSAGGMSGGSLTTCPVPPAKGALTDLLIDDLEDGDNGVSKIGGRSGFWYTYLDTLGSTIIPAPDPAGASPLKPGSTMCNGGSMKCVLISGVTAAADEALLKYPYAGVGFDFSNAKKPCAYDASAYAGIKFSARGDVPITIKLNTTATATPDGGGVCAGEGCNGGYSPAGADVVLTAAWQEISIPFATAAGPTWAIASTVPLAKASLLSVQVQIPAGQTYSVALDDFTFY